MSEKFEVKMSAGCVRLILTRLGEENYECRIEYGMYGRKEATGKSYKEAYEKCQSK